MLLDSFNFTLWQYFRSRLTHLPILKINLLQRDMPLKSTSELFEINELFEMKSVRTIYDHCQQCHIVVKFQTTYQKRYQTTSDLKI